MAIGDSKEDLSAYSREDLVYKAKLAEQAERYARANWKRDRWMDGWMDRSIEGLSFFWIYRRCFTASFVR